MCINNTLVCNGVQNCVYPWDENHCKGDRLLPGFSSPSPLLKESVTGFAWFHIFSCVPPPEKRSKGIFHQITKTHGTVIGVSSGIVLVLLIISILVQMKQPRKKVAPLVGQITYCSVSTQKMNRWCFVATRAKCYRISPFLQGRAFKNIICRGQGEPCRGFPLRFLHRFISV